MLKVTLSMVEIVLQRCNTTGGKIRCNRSNIRRSEDLLMAMRYVIVQKCPVPNTMIVMFFTESVNNILKRKSQLKTHFLTQLHGISPMIIERMNTSCGVDVWRGGPKM